MGSEGINTAGKWKIKSFRKISFYALLCWRLCHIKPSPVAASWSCSTNYCGISWESGLKTRVKPSHNPRHLFLPWSILHALHPTSKPLLFKQFLTESVHFFVVDSLDEFPYTPRRIPLLATLLYFIISKSSAYGDLLPVGFHPGDCFPFPCGK